MSDYVFLVVVARSKIFDTTVCRMECDTSRRACSSDTQALREVRGVYMEKRGLWTAQ